MTSAELHALCDMYWKAKMPSVDADPLGFGWMQSMELMECWRQDKQWIDSGCVLIGNFNGDGKYSAPPSWWPANA